MSISPQPKPAKSGPAPRKRIPRVRANGKRNMVPAALAAHRELEQRADKLWSLIVRSRCELCQRCGMRPAQHPHHLVSRRYRFTRWDPTNGANICAGCHMLVGQDGDENRRLAHRLVGEEGWAWLNVSKHFGKVDVAMTIVALRAIGIKGGAE